MRFDGTLAKWNDERGFGFIAPLGGGQEIFIHISAFPRDGRRPRIDEPLSFEIDLNKDGKKRAVNVLRPSTMGAGSAGAPRALPLRSPAHRPARTRRAGSDWASRAIVVALLCGIGAYAYEHYTRRVAAHLADAVPAASTAPSGDAFHCDGRTHCSQMNSCAEATYFLKNCPGTQMDGNHDGVPCEQQWCTGAFAK